MVLSGNRYYSLLAIICFSAFALRVAITGYFQGLESPPSFSANPDQVEYELLAFHLSTGDGYCLTPGQPTGCRPPGTSFSLLPVYAIFGRSFLAGRLWFCLLSAATCLPLAWLATKCFGPAVGLVSAAWLTLYPGHFYYSMHFLSEVPATLCLVLASGLTWAAWKKSAFGYDLLAGMVWGFAVLTRPQVALMFPIALLIVMFFRRGRRSTALAHLGIQMVVLMAVVGPWVVRNAVVMGKPALCTIVGGYTFWGANNDVVLADEHLRGSWVSADALLDAAHPLQGSEIEREEAAWKYGRAFVQSHSTAMPLLCLMKLWRLFSPFSDTPNRPVFWAFAACWLITFPFVLGGVFIGARENLGAVIIPAISLLATMLSAVVFYGSPRFLHGIAPLLIMFAALALVQLLKIDRGSETQAAEFAKGR